MAAMIIGSNELTLTSDVKIFKDGKEITVKEAGEIIKIYKDGKQINVKVEIDDDGKNRAII